MMRKSSTFRNSIIWVVVILLASYVFFSFGTAPATVQDQQIASIGDVSVKVRDAKIRKRNMAPGLPGLKPEDIDNLTVSALLSDAVLINSAEEADLVVSDEELRDYVIQLRSDQQGNFLNNEQWTRNIQRNYDLQVETFENYLRNYSLLGDKFRNLFFRSTYLSEDMIKSKYLENYQRVDLDMLVVSTFEIQNEVGLTTDEELKTFFDSNGEEFISGPLRKIRYVDAELDKNIEVSDEQVAEFYTTNQQRYRQPEQVQASHVLIKTDSRSEEEALEKVKEVQAEIAGGLDFAEAAKKYSEDSSNKDRGGSLGMFGRGRMVPPFEEASFSMNIGDISEPVKTQFGYHLIKKEAHNQEGTRPLEQVSPAIRNELKTRNAKEIATKKLEDFKAKVSAGADFAKQAEEMGLTLRTSRFFDEDRQSNLGDPLAKSFQARRNSFLLESINDVSDPVDLGNRVIVIQWIEESDPQPLSFEDDKDRIRLKAKELAGKKLLGETFAAIREKAQKNPEVSLNELRQEYSFFKDNHYRNSGFVSGSTLPWELRQLNLDFNKDIYSVEKNGFLEINEGASPNRLVLARVVEKEEADMDKFAEERVAIIEQLRNQQGSDLFSNYFYATLKKYDPNDKQQAQLREAVSQIR